MRILRLTQVARFDRVIRNSAGERERINLPAGVSATPLLLLARLRLSFGKT